MFKIFLLMTVLAAVSCTAQENKDLNQLRAVLPRGQPMPYHPQFAPHPRLVRRAAPNPEAVNIEAEDPAVAGAPLEDEESLEKAETYWKKFGYGYGYGYYPKFYYKHHFGHHYSPYSYFW